MLTPLAGGTPLVIAYSGGLDSHVLLHACVAAGQSVRAIHIHHGLQAEADAWVEHCRNVCRHLKVELDVIYVDASARPRQSPEEAARIARYMALTGAMRGEEILLTAQHADDQSETFLLQLLRGGGAAGLAAMPLLQRNQGVTHLRPLLSFSRDELADYARQQRLNWIEDPSNANTVYDRNYLRQAVMPVLKQRWPSINRSLATAARLQQDNLEILEAMAAVDLAALITQDAMVLAITGLKQLSVARQMNLLRYWLKQQAGVKPTRKILQEIRRAVIYAVEDASPLLEWGGFELRRFRQKLYLLPSLPAFDHKQVLNWPPQQALTIAPLGIQLQRGEISKAAEPRLKPLLRQRALQIRFRQGGEQIQPAGHPHHQRLKQLFLQAGIPPWQRDKIPLIYDGDTLIAVAGYWLAQNACSLPGEASWRIEVAPV